MTRRLLKQRYMASLHGRHGHAYRVYISRETVADLQAIYESNPIAYSDDMRVQDMASLFLEKQAFGQAWYEQQVHRFPRLVGENNASE